MKSKSRQELIKNENPSMPGQVRKTVLIILLSILVSLIALLIFISPLVKYLVEKYDYEYSGRQIHIDQVNFNPLTGYLQLKNVRIEELNKKSDFLCANSISLKINPLKIFNRRIEINNLIIKQMRTNFVQSGNKFNFDDLLLKLKSKPGTISKNRKYTIHIKNILITETEFHYSDLITPVHYYIKNMRIKSNGDFLYQNKIDFMFSFISGSGSGKISGKFALDIKNLNYKLNLKVEKYDLGFIEPYLREFSNYGTFTANLDADIKTDGSFKSKENINLTGKIGINKFHFGSAKDHDYASFDRLLIDIDALNPKKHMYFFDSVTLDKPYLLYELYDSDNNFEKMFGEDGSKVIAAGSVNAKFNLVIEVARYVKVLADNFFKSDYLINHIAINKGDLRFNDFSVGERFSMALSPLNLDADSVSKKYKRVNINASSEIKPYGLAIARLSINPNDSSDFDLNYHFSRIPISAFNPYFISYSSYTINRGTIEMNGNWNVRNGEIKSDNHLLLIDPRNSDRIINKGNKWVPLPLIFAMVRENGNVIDYEIPVNGNLEDPKFKLKDIIYDLLSNLLTKPFTTPYRYDVKRKEIKIEESMAIMWATNQCELNPISKKFAEKIAKHLAENPASKINLQDQIYSLKEKEYILFFEAKKKFYITSKGLNASLLSDKDQRNIQKMSIRDPAFIRYLDKKTSHKKLFTIQAKCMALLGSDIVNLKYAQLTKKRKEVIQRIFSDRAVLHQVITAKEKILIPYNGFSFIKIDYLGKIPDYLLQAYIEMYRLNNLAPRKRFQKTRSVIKNSSDNLSVSPK